MITTHTPPCSCMGHRFPNVRHAVACCNEPHIDQVSSDELVEEIRRRFEEVGS